MKIKYSLKPIAEIAFSKKTHDLLREGGFDIINNFEKLRKAKITVVGKHESEGLQYCFIHTNIKVLKNSYYPNGFHKECCIYKGALEEMRRYKKIEDIEKFD